MSVRRTGSLISMSGFEKQRLGRLRDAMVAHVEQGTVPGLVTAVSRHGEVQIEAVGTMAFGDAPGAALGDVPAEPATVGSGPMAHDSIFRISSMTKPITAVATMILVEEC